MRWLAVTASVLALAISAEPVARADDDMGARVGGADQAFNNDFPGYGMTGLRPQRGFSATFP
jgi:hypothetical protein